MYNFVVLGQQEVQASCPTWGWNPCKLGRRRKKVLELGDSCCSPDGAGGRGGGTGSEAFVGQSWYFATEAKCCSTRKYISFFPVIVVEVRLAKRCVTLWCREREDLEQQVWPLFIGFPHFPSQNEEVSMAQLTRICMALE